MPDKCPKLSDQIKRKEIAEIEQTRTSFSPILEPLEDTETLPMKEEKMNCEMCGKENGTFASRLYQYENGETFRALVCFVCADLHDRLVSK